MPVKIKKIIYRLNFIGVITGVLSILCSCGGRPSNVLSEDKMVSLLVDMQLAEAYENNQTALGSERMEMGKKVLQQHGVSEETLDTTLAWYGRNVDDYTELFEKVDKELLKRKKKYLANDMPNRNLKENDLWPYPQHLVISPLSGYDYLSFSLDNLELEKGAILDFSFFMPDPIGLKNTLAVEYTDGYGEALVSTATSRNKFNLNLQTDTAKTVSKIFGVLQVKDVKKLPLFIDSISLKALPFDTLTYRNNKRSQKSFKI